MKKLTSILLVALAFVFNACATLQVDKPAVSAVKKIAIVGFSVEQKEPEGWKFGSSQNDLPNWGAGLVQAAPHASSIYANVGKTLAKKFRWQVLGADGLRKNASYSKLFDEKMKGWQSRPPTASGYKAYGADGVMDPWPIERLSPEERKALAKSLGVQALAVARVKVELEKGGGLERLVGAGELKPKATMQFTLYAKDGGDPIWQDLQAVGPAVEKGTQHVLGITSFESLLSQSVEAVNKSLSKLLARYDKGE
ncbi:MAG: hypothetical protein KDD51_16730 [Bdellovibrionales bacterium]|nr:hypothetical protein [Bdellovibrionales bacterium]MCB0418936.1 hypothetical protein [Bdellovibrionales bacterium]MCB9255405.1 hypothetical protein [Pseudobdellovibrionaceae bacterium]